MNTPPRPSAPPQSSLDILRHFSFSPLYIFLCFTLCYSIYLSFYPFIHFLSIYVFIYLSTYLYVYLHIYFTFQIVNKYLAVYYQWNNHCTIQYLFFHIWSSILRDFDPLLTIPSFTFLIRIELEILRIKIIGLKLVVKVWNINIFEFGFV